MKNSIEEKKVLSAISDLRKILKKHELKYFRTALRRLDKGISERKRLLKQKRELEASLKKIESRIK